MTIKVGSKFILKSDSRVVIKIVEIHYNNNIYYRADTVKDIKDRGSNILLLKAGSNWDNFLKEDQLIKDYNPYGNIRKSPGWL